MAFEQCVHLSRNYQVFCSLSGTLEAATPAEKAHTSRERNSPASPVLLRHRVRCTQKTILAFGSTRTSLALTCTHYRTGVMQSGRRHPGAGGHPKTLDAGADRCPEPEFLGRK